MAISDKIGRTNRSLVLRSCDAGGRLLTADTPACEMDAHFAHLAFGRAAAAQEAPGSCGLQQNVDFPGNDLGKARHNVTSPAACCTLCSATPDCFAFSWLSTLPPFVNYCSLKTSAGKPTHAQGHISGCPGGCDPPPPSNSSVPGIDGHLQSATVTLRSTAAGASNAFVFSYVLAIAVAKAYNLSMAELSYDPKVKLAAVEQRSPSHARSLNGASSLQITPCGLDDFHVFTVAPVFANGWALLGEPGKWVSVSRQRFAIRSAPIHAWATVTLEVSGTPLEAVTVSCRSPSGKAVDVVCTLPGSGRAVLYVGGNGAPEPVYQGAA